MRRKIYKYCFFITSEKKKNMFRKPCLFADFGICPYAPSPPFVTQGKKIKREDREWPTSLF
jgi:hypothetical protein